MAPEFYCCPTLRVGRLLVGSFCSVDKTIWMLETSGRYYRREGLAEEEAVGEVGDGEDPEVVAEEVAR
jgi:hypothetical protein